MASLKGRIALVTGASRGIGAAVAKRFAKEGAHVIITARTVGGLEEVDDEIRNMGGAATIIPADLSRFDKIDEMAFAIMQRFGKLDILVGNAATIGVLSPITHLPPDKWEEVMRLNLTANWRILRAFDPLLKLSNAGRAMFVSSGVTRGAFPFWGAYSISKSGLEMLVKTYAAETEKTKIKANIIDPGVVRTRMRAEAFPGENPEALPLPETITDIFVKLGEENFEETGKIFNA